MMARLHDKAFDNTDWIFEIKWDGYRAITEINGEASRIYSRNGLSFHNKYPYLFQAISEIKGKMIVDGEIVAINEKGHPDFQLLQQYEPDSAVPLVYYVFDILEYKGKSLEEKTLLERKELLKKYLPESDLIKYCDHVSEKGIEFFDAVKKQNLEGMIAKKADSNYYEGTRSELWLKVKQVQSEEAVICGYTAPRNSRKYFGALILAVYESKKLTYIGHTGTGFNDKTLKELYHTFQDYKTKESPFEEKIPLNAPVTWLKPALICNVKFSEKTKDGILRHPVFLGLRIDKEVEEVTTEQESLPSKEKTNDMENTRTISGKKLIFSNLDKIYFPEDRVTKGDVIEYYDNISKYILPYLKDRPQSMRRNPNGIHESSFFQKDAGDAAPDWMENYKVWSESSDKEINYIVCNNKPALLYMANLGCIEINPWNSRTSNPDNPDYLIMDLDPSEKNTFDQVIETANVIHEILETAGCDNYCKTSGSTGLHIYVPLAAKYNYDQARMFAEMIAALTVDQLPEFTTTERNLKKRGNKHIYVDYLQNRSGQTLSCAYSLRPKIGATVSTPLEWKEVKKGLSIQDFTIHNIFDRLKKKGDLFTPVLKKGIDMEKVLRKLEK